MEGRAEYYANCIGRVGASLAIFLEFIVCTKVQISRPAGPSANQRAFFSGDKRFHALSYKTIMTFDGLLFSLYGPLECRKHDLTLLRSSGLESKLATSLMIVDNQYHMYGNAAYCLKP